MPTGLPREQPPPCGTNKEVNPTSYRRMSDRRRRASPTHTFHMPIKEELVTHRAMHWLVRQVTPPGDGGIDVALVHVRNRKHARGWKIVVEGRKFERVGLGRHRITEGRDAVHRIG